MIDRRYVDDLQAMLYYANRKLVQLSNPFNVTINGKEQTINSLLELKDLLEQYKEPIVIQLEPKKLEYKKRR